MDPSAARTGMTLAGAAVTFAILQSAARRGESSPALYTIYALADLALHMMCVQAVSFGAEMGLKVSTCWDVCRCCASQWLALGPSYLPAARSAECCLKRQSSSDVEEKRGDGEVG